MSYEFNGRNLDGDICRTGYYGMELVLDCHHCDITRFTRKDLREYFKGLVKLLGMKAGTLHFWDDVGVSENEKQTDPMTTGTSAIQFILTSNITVHCLDLLGNVYVNVFSCKDFDSGRARYYTQNFFDAKTVREHKLIRS